MRKAAFTPVSYTHLDVYKRQAKGNVLYVGKAKSLKKRVASYAKSGGHTERIARMISETSEMIFVTTASETEALLLESNLIKLSLIHI